MRTVFSLRRKRPEMVVKSFRFEFAEVYLGLGHGTRIFGTVASSRKPCGPGIPWMDFILRQ